MGISLTQYRATIGQYKCRVIIRRWSSSASWETYSNDTRKALGLVNIASLISIILGLSTIIISRQCLLILLLISGIEKNPGPVSQEILDELIRRSTDETTKNIIKAYNPGQHLKSQKAAMRKFKKKNSLQP